MSERTGRLSRVARTVLSAVLLGLFLFPIYYLVVASLLGPEHLFDDPPRVVPVPPSAEFYRQAVEQAPIVTWARNSLVVVLGTIAVALPIAILAAYSIARFEYRGRRIAGRGMLVLYLFPSALLFVPLFVILSQLRLTNNLVALVLAHATFALPFGVWFLSSYLRGIPRELDEAGLVDGCTRLNVLWKILLPVMLPGIAASAAFLFIFSWNEYGFALTLIQRAELRTMPLGLSSYLDSQIGTMPWGVILATSVLMSLPVVIAVQIAQRFFVSGLAAGSVKG